MKNSNEPAAKTPLYKQIKTHITKQIKENVWLPDQRIPSEYELADQFKVSRITVRGALTELSEEGLIYRLRGKGSFVHEDAGRLFHTEQKDLSGSRLIALLIPRLDNRFTANVVSGIEEELAAQGYQLLVCRTHDSKELEKKKLQEMVKLGVDGMIVYPISDETYNEEILKLSINRFPVVVVDRYLRGIETNCVCSDNVGGAFQAASHLIELGHRHIAFVSSDQKTTSIEDRLSGYQQALAEHNLPLEYRYQMLLRIHQGKVEPHHKELLKQFFVNNPDLTACFAAHYSLALLILQVLQELGKSVPRDFSVVCFDDYEGSEYASVPLTCVDQQDFELGRQASKLLLANLQSPDQDRKKVLIPVTFIPRNSSGPVKEK